MFSPDISGWGEHEIFKAHRHRPIDYDRRRTGDSIRWRARPERAMRWRGTLLCVVRTKRHGRRSSGHEKARSVSGQGPFGARASTRPAGKLVLLHADAEHRFPWSVRRPSALAARLCMAALHRGGPRAPRRRDVMMRAAAPRRTPAARRRPVTSRPHPTPHPPFPAATVRQQASDRHVASRTWPPKIQ